MVCYILFIQHDPRESLDLSSHICRDIEVSIAIVNKYGQSNYSSVANVFVSEGKQLRSGKLKLNSILLLIYIFSLSFFMHSL